MRRVLAIATLLLLFAPVVCAQRGGFHGGGGFHGIPSSVTSMSGGRFHGISPSVTSFAPRSFGSPRFVGGGFQHFGGPRFVGGTRFVGARHFHGTSVFVGGNFGFGHNRFGVSFGHGFHHGHFHNGFAFGFFGAPFYYAYPYYYPYYPPYPYYGYDPYYAYQQPAYPIAYQSAPAYDRGDDSLAREVDRLRDEVDRLRDERSGGYDRERVPQPPPPQSEARPQAPQPATVLVFRDGKHVETSNYAIAGQTLWIFSEQRARKVPIAELDLEATRAANEERGVEFNGGRR